MPTLDHLALWVDDLDRVCDFYVEHFGATRGQLYDNPTKGFRSRFLTFGAGARLEVMTTRTLTPARHTPGAERMGLTHLAIALDSEHDVDTLTDRLRAAGVPVLDGPRRTGDGYYESVILDPEGNRVELTASTPP